MATAIAQIVAAGISYLAARGIDAIIGRYLAAITVAFEKSASAGALTTYRQGLKEVSAGIGDKWKDWEKWRNGSST